MILGIGVDVVSVDRLAGVLERRPRLLQRVFWPQEVADSGRGPERERRLAARWAAKEAARKALGVPGGKLGWRDVAVGRDGGGRPRLLLTGEAARRAAELGVRRAHVSLSHERRYAVAQVVLEG